MECKQIQQRCLGGKHLLRLIPWFLAFCGDATGSQSPFRVAQLPAPSCRLLNPVLAGHLVIPAAIPLPPVVPRQAQVAINKRVELGKSREEPRQLGSVSEQDAFEGSLDFAHPEYLWLQQFSRATDEPVNNLPDIWWQSNYNVEPSLVPVDEWHTSRELLQHTRDQGEPRLQGFDTTTGSENQWIMYTSSLSLGFALFLLLVCGLVARGYRFHDHTFIFGPPGDSSVYMTDDGSGTNATDSSGWLRLTRALLRIAPPSEEFSEGLSASQIQKLPLSQYCGSKHGTSEGPFVCTICLGDIKPGDMLRKIHTCHHQFHSSCVDAWLARSATCPLCRHEIVTDNRYEKTSDNLSNDEHVHSPVSLHGPSGSYPEGLGTNDGSVVSMDTEDDLSDSAANMNLEEDMNCSYVNLDEREDSNSTTENQYLPNSFAARSFESTSWSETGESISGEWELVEMEA